MLYCATFKTKQLCILNVNWKRILYSTVRTTTYVFEMKTSEGGVFENDLKSSPVFQANIVWRINIVFNIFFRPLQQIYQRVSAFQAQLRTWQANGQKIRGMLLRSNCLCNRGRIRIPDKAGGNVLGSKWRLEFWIKFNQQNPRKLFFKEI